MGSSEAEVGAVSATPDSVAIVVPSMMSGGAERVAASLANAWAARGRAVGLISLTSQDSDSYLLDRRVRRVALALASPSAGVAEALWANVRRVRALRRALARLRPDAILALTTIAGVLAILAARGLGRPVVVSERTYPPMSPLRAPWDLLRGLTYPAARRVSMQTSEGMSWLRRRIPRARGIVIPNAATYPLPAGRPVLPPAEVVPPGARLLLAVGRLSPEKQLDRAVAAFARIAPALTSWQLVILGDGPERASLERQVAVLGLGRRVTLPGRVGNVGDWYARADLYVLSSRYEGFPNTLVEAMAHGCPAVSYDCDTGPRDIVSHEVDGLLVSPPGDVAALAVALGRLMGDPAERARLAARAGDVRTRFSSDRILSMWDEALGLSRPPAGSGAQTRGTHEPDLDAVSRS